MTEDQPEQEALAWLVDVGQAANVLQLAKDEARRLLEAMCLPPPGLLEHKGHTSAASRCAR